MTVLNIMESLVEVPLLCKGDSFESSFSVSGFTETDLGRSKFWFKRDTFLVY